MNDTDRKHLERCLELAEKALELGNSPFGSVLVDGDGKVLAEDHNREVLDSDDTLHPEFELARWAAHNMTREARAKATVYTSGEHCPMCSAAHAWVGLGRIVYLYSATQYRALSDANGMPPSRSPRSRRTRSPPSSRSRAPSRRSPAGSRHCTSAASQRSKASKAKGPASPRAPDR